MDRLAVVSRVASRLAAAAARAPTISCAAFHKAWSSTSSPDPVRAPTAPVLFEARAAGTRAGAAAWEHVAPASPAGLRLARGRGGRRRRGRAPSAPTTATGLPRVHGGADFLRTRFFRDGCKKTTLHEARRSRCGDPCLRPGSSLWAWCARKPTRAHPRWTRSDAFAANWSPPPSARAARAGVGEGAPALWVVENASRTLSFSPTIREGLLPGPDPDAFLDIRVPTGLPGDPASANPPVTSPRDSETGEERRRDASPDDVDAAGSGVDAKTVVDFHRVWHSFNAGAAAGDFSVWRARRPPGWVSLGDVAVAGLEPPARTVMFRESKRRDERDATVAFPRRSRRPAAFERVWRDSGWRARGKPRGTLSFWRPVPSEGYVACGHVASDTHAPPPIDVVACLRADLACAVPPSAMGSASFARGGRRKFAGKRSAAAPVASLWSAEGAGFKLGREPLRIWRPRAPLRVFAEDDDAGDENGWLALGATPRRRGRRGWTRRARAPRARARARAPEFAPRAAGLPRDGTVFAARVERVETTLFVNESRNRTNRTRDDTSNSVRADAVPIARVAMRRVSLDARAGASGARLRSARASAVAEASHFNARVAAWEPVVEPWEVAARYEATGLGSLGSPATSLGSPGEASDLQDRSTRSLAARQSASRARRRCAPWRRALSPRTRRSRRAAGSPSAGGASVAALSKGVSLCTKA